MRNLNYKQTRKKRGGRSTKKVWLRAQRANANKKARYKALNKKRKIINLKSKINTKFQHLKIRAEFKIVKNNKNFKRTAQKIIKILKF